MNETAIKQTAIIPTSREQATLLIGEESWITSLFSFIRLGSGLTLLQQDTMMMVMDHLQKYIKTFFDLNMHKSKGKPRPLFTQYMLEQGIPPFKIYFSELGINTSNYRVVRDAIEEMNMLVEHPELDENGIQTTTTIFSPVFKKFSVPATGDKYVKRDASGEVLMESARHYGYVEVEINNDVAQYAFDMSQGYINHPKLIARHATKKSTPLLYFLLMREMGRSKSTTLRLTLQDVKDFLGFETYKDEQTGEWVVPYAKFAHFKSKVLDAVQADLDRMASENHTDITFTYDTIYNGGRRRGDPDYIEFHVRSTRLGMAYNLLTGTDTPATDEAKAAKKVVELDLFAQQQANELTKQQAEQAWQRCYQDFKQQLGLTGADVWFREYDDTTKTVTFAYDKGCTDVANSLTTGSDSQRFLSIVRQYFGQQVRVSLQRSGW